MRWCLVTLLTASGLCAAEPTSQAVDFATQVAPLLQKRCLQCHGPARTKSGLRLDSGGSIRKGGNNGMAIRPGNSGDSPLIQRLTSANGDVRMPPAGPPLAPQEIAFLKAWIDQGAKWPEGMILSAGKRPAPQTHWSWQPLRRPELPVVKHFAWVQNPIDRFVLARLEAEGIAPAPPADLRTLARRLYLDLIGLPPAPEELDAFELSAQRDRQAAVAALVDCLLQSPHYGEKWARPWLDLCHYADTDGYLTDQPRPVAWRYRQWLVNALNRDLPFDQFTIEQLAGDLLPGATTDQVLATGFLRNTLSNREGGADLEEFRVEQVVDRTMMVGTIWLGLTVGCARCHDHKFDPISQKEFFQLYAFLDRADELNINAPLPGEWQPYQAKKPEYERQRAELLRPVAGEVALLQRRWEGRLLEAVARPGRDHVWDRQWELLGLIWGGHLGEGQLEGCQIVLLDPARRTQVQTDRLLGYFLRNGSIIDLPRFAELKLAEVVQKLDALEKTLPKLTRAPVMAETQNLRKVHVHLRGDFRSRGIEVGPGTPKLLPPLPADAPHNRLGLARWLVAAENPLTARVQVNRLWQEHFGRGLVLTSEDFGTRGERPSHAELLDWLAVEFRARGWSEKALHRLIVTSAAYQQSARAPPELHSRDPLNRLLARQEPLRLSAEQIRDATLAVSGLLARKVGGPCVFPPQPESVAMEGFENKWVASQGEDRYRRSLYIWVHRLSPFAQKVIFDAPAPNRMCSRRERSNTPLQALTLLNDPASFETAQALAKRLLAECKEETSRLDRAFQLCLARAPSRRETERLRHYLVRQRAIFRKDTQAAEKVFPGPVPGSDRLEAAAWTAVASVLLNLHEFITRD
jgi:hypothetical protein